MRRNSLFWGVAVFIFGGLLFLKAAGIVTANLIGFVWPILLMLAGVWILTERFFPNSYRVGEMNEGEEFSIPLQGAAKAVFRMEHGAGAVRFSSGAKAGDFLNGLSGVAMNHSSKLDGDTLRVGVEAGPSIIPFIGPGGGRWDFRMTNEIPFEFKFEGGATNFELNAEDLKITRAEFEAGASSINLTLPKVGQSRFTIEGGAASINIKVPEGVALRFRFNGGATSINVDKTRFPLIDRNVYESPDFNSAPNRCDFEFDGGASSVQIN